MKRPPLHVLCFGEALVDFLPDRRGRLRDCERFEAHSGGAPANVAVGVARLGLEAGFCGVVGDDEFGRLLERKLRGEGAHRSVVRRPRSPRRSHLLLAERHARRRQAHRRRRRPPRADSASSLAPLRDLEPRPARGTARARGSGPARPLGRRAGLVRSQRPRPPLARPARFADALRAGLSFLRRGEARSRGDGGLHGRTRSAAGGGRAHFTRREARMHHARRRRRLCEAGSARIPRTGAARPPRTPGSGRDRDNPRDRRASG